MTQDTLRFETPQFGEHHIKINRDALTTDIFSNHETIAPEIPRQRIAKLIDNLTISTSLQECLFLPTRVASSSGDVHQPLLMIYPRGIVRAARIQPNHPPELINLQIQKTLTRVWSHERTHLIDRADPGYEEKMEIIRLNELMVATSIPTILLTLGYMTNLNTLGSVANIVSASVTATGTFIAVNELMQYFSDSEKRARQNEHNPIVQGIFCVSKG